MQEKKRKLTCFFHEPFTMSTKHLPKLPLSSVYSFWNFRQNMADWCRAICSLWNFNTTGYLKPLLTHWGQETHICVSTLTIIGSDKGLLPARRQAIIWTNAGIFLIGPLGTNFSEILIEIQAFSFQKMHLKMSSGKWCHFVLASMCYGWMTCEFWMQDIFHQMECWKQLPLHLSKAIPTEWNKIFSQNGNWGLKLDINECKNNVTLVH